MVALSFGGFIWLNGPCFVVWLVSFLLYEYTYVCWNADPSGTNAVNSGMKRVDFRDCFFTRNKRVHKLISSYEDGFSEFSQPVGRFHF